MLKQRPFLVETLTAIGLIAAPFVLPYLGFAPNTVNRILVWGLFGIGFDILFGYTGLLSFGQSAFYGTGGFVAAYLLTRAGFPHVVLALVIGMIAAAVVGYLVGLIALRRTGIYFAMITVAIAEVFYLRRVQSAVGLDRRRERPARRADAELRSRLHHAPFHHRLVALSVPRVLLLHRHRDRAAHRALAGRRDPERDPRQPAARRRRRPQHPRLQARPPS